VEKYAGVARRLALEFQTKVEVAIGFLRGEVAVLSGRAFAKNRAVLSNPALFAVDFPACQIFSVENTNPSVFPMRLGQSSNREKESGRNRSTHSLACTAPLVHHKPCVPAEAHLSAAGNVTASHQEGTLSHAGRARFASKEVGGEEQGRCQGRAEQKALCSTPRATANSSRKAGRE